MKKLVLYTDGASRGNPGPAGIGALLYDAKGRLVAEISEYLGEATNNVAEYTALIKALNKALELGAEEVQIYTDSELLTRQINGSYRVKSEGLKPLFLEVMALKRRFAAFSINHVSREKNKEADRLANLGIDAFQNQ
ncbi:MAG: ribonuclease HI family protein [Clostridia bacterium]|jgi:ribonuclease HI|nr:ribonuclease HI family protein [Clostridia bacterium]